jgi:hypothetical protein
MKIQIQKLKSSKLFYNKWPYKVECTIFGAYLVGRYNLTALKEWCNGAPGLLGIGNSYGAKNINKADLLIFVAAAERYIKNDRVKIRTEGNKFNLFCKDKDTLEEIEQQLRKWIRKISGPTTDEELEYLLSNGHKKILCDSFPKEKYQYKLFFKTKISAERRKQFLEWSSNYNEKLEVSGTSKLWLEGRKPYVQNPFMYIEDDKMLSMIGMFLSGHVRKVEHFLLRTSTLQA